MEKQGLFLFPGARVLIYFEKKAFLGHANIYNRFKVRTCNHFDFVSIL